jgi:hypothetical protein
MPRQLQSGTTSTALPPPLNTSSPLTAPPPPTRQVVACPSFADAAPDLMAFLAGADLHGYNAIKYDVPLLAKEFSRCGATFPEPGTQVGVVVSGWVSRGWGCWLVTHMMLPGGRLACGAWQALAHQHSRACIASAGASLVRVGQPRPGALTAHTSTACAAAQQPERSSQSAAARAQQPERSSQSAAARAQQPERSSQSAAGAHETTVCLPLCTTV